MFVQEEVCTPLISHSRTSVTITIDSLTSLAHKIMLHAFHVSMEFQTCSVGCTVQQPFPLGMSVTILLHQLEIQMIVTADKIQLTFKIHIQFSISSPL
jgi:hypothetical protein